MMNVLIMRHGIAQEREEFAKAHPAEDDGARPLTGRGRKRMRAAARHWFGRCRPGTSWRRASGAPAGGGA